MLSALLPGVREFRTPLVTGLLWGACVWLLVGSRVAESDKTSDFVEKYHLDSLPPSAWLAAGVLVAYLVGSLLAIRGPQRFPELPFPSGDKFPTDIEHWLLKEFDSLKDSGVVPGMQEIFSPRKSAPGFDTLYTAESVKQFEAWQEKDGNVQLLGLGWHGQGDLFHAFTWDFVAGVKEEESAIGTRIQMRFPEVFSEIDRIRSEAELRYSIALPLTVLCVLLACLWSPWATLGVILPPLLVLGAWRRSKEASLKTWNVVMAREIGTPTLDAIKDFNRDMTSHLCQRFEKLTREP